MEKTKVYIFAKQSLFWQGVEHYLSGQDFEVSRASEINNSVLSAVENLPPDLAIVDIDMPGGIGLAISYQLKQHLPNIGIITLTSKDNDVQIFEALKAQASACLSKEVTADELVDTIRNVARGEHPINESLITHPILADQVLMQFQELSRQRVTQAISSPLSRREIEVLEQIAQGLANKQIAYQLGISEQTIKNHITSILRKLNVNARTEAAVLAIKQGLVIVE